MRRLIAHIPDCLCQLGECGISLMKVQELRLSQQFTFHCLFIHMECLLRHSTVTKVAVK